MPIILLKEIKFGRSSNPKILNKDEMLYQNFSSSHVVGAYVFACEDLKSNQPLFNDGFPSLIFMPRQTDDVRLKTKTSIIDLKSAWVCCGVIQNTHWEIPKGLEYIIVLRFKPSSFYSIFKVDPLIFKDNPICSLDDIVDESWKQIVDKMYQHDEVSQRMSFLENVLSLFDTHGYLPYILEKAIDYIEDKKGNTTVADVINELGEKVNHKWLHRNFVRYLGISPKKYISLQRFIYTYGQYENRPEDLLGIALNSGYYDYNHFFKDFKQYMGVAPSQYRWEV